MRRLAIAVSVLLGALSLSGCGPNPKELEPGLRTMLQDFAKAVVTKNDEKINMYVLAQAGQTGNPVGAKDLDDPEGRKRIIEGNRKWVRKAFKDAGLTEEKDVDVFMQAIHMNISAKDAMVTYEIAAEQRRVAETVTFRLTLTDKGWRILDYYREMKTR
jgi:hypothetical protein